MPLKFALQDGQKACGTVDAVHAARREVHILHFLERGTHLTAIVRTTNWALRTVVQLMFFHFVRREIDTAVERTFDLKGVVKELEQWIFGERNVVALVVLLTANRTLSTGRACRKTRSVFMIVFECFLKARLAKRMSTGGELDRLPGEPLADITQEMPGRTVDPDHEVLAITRVPFVRIVDDRLNSVGQHTTHFDNLD